MADAVAQMFVRAAPEAVIDAFVDPARVTRFWFARLDGPLEPGTHRHFWIDPDGEPAIDVHVRELTSGRLLHFDWGAGDDLAPVAIVVRPAGEARSYVRMTEGGHDPSSSEGLARLLDSTCGFNIVLTAAKAYLEHGVDMPIVADHASGPPD